MNRFQRKPVLPKARTAADRERDLIKFLACARPEKVQQQTAETLASTYGVKIDVAHRAMEKFGGLL